MKVSVGYVFDRSQIVAIANQHLRLSGAVAPGLGIGDSTGAVSKNLLVNVSYVSFVGEHALVITVAPFAKQTLQHGG